MRTTEIATPGQMTCGPYQPRSAIPCTRPGLQADSSTDIARHYHSHDPEHARNGSSTGVMDQGR